MSWGTLSLRIRIVAQVYNACSARLSPRTTRKAQLLQNVRPARRDVPPFFPLLALSVCWR